MRTKNTYSIKLITKFAEEIQLTPEQSVPVLSRMKRHAKGFGKSRGVIFSDADGTEHGYLYKCLCGYERTPITTEELDDKPCKQINCFDCRGCTDEEGA